ncbi:hypothetical protein QM012_002568 [Aureobasidium pullulans]|uniref:BZIP domain-containing protein n=1 Tax=Aureobasidium pullulans TaxID=5580 RepID=A0ABR0TAV5_AURPU
MADREEDTVAPAGSSDAGPADYSTATSLEDALNVGESHGAEQSDTLTGNAMEDALAASLEVLNDDSIIRQTAYALLDYPLRDTNAAGMGQDNTFTVNTMEEGYSFPVDSLNLGDPSKVTQYNTFDETAEEDVDKDISEPVETPEIDNIHQATSKSPSDHSGDAQALGAQLGSTYQTTSSPEMKQIIACLVHLDTALTQQTHLNNLHEAHTAKNFCEQRHLNKHRKLHLLETIQNVNKKLARFDAQRMETEKLVKQCEIRVNSYRLQLQGLKERVKMLANGGEWMEAELAKMTARFEVIQQENIKLKGRNKHLQDKVRGLEEEVNVLKERDGVWERRMTALGEFIKEKRESDWVEVAIDKEPVLDVVRFSVGNYRIFSTYY